MDKNASLRRIKLFKCSHTDIEWQSQAIKQAFSTHDLSKGWWQTPVRNMSHHATEKLTNAKNSDDTELACHNKREAIDQENGTQNNPVIQWSRMQDLVIQLNHFPLARKNQWRKSQLEPSMAIRPQVIAKMMMRKNSHKLVTLSQWKVNQWQEPQIE